MELLSNKINMKDELDYVFYRFYIFQVSVGNGNIAIVFSFLFLSFLVMLNFFALAHLLYAFLGIKIPFQNATIGGLTILGVIFMINYFLFIYNKKYQKIIKKYKNENSLRVRNGNIAAFVYMIVSFIMIGLGFYLMLMRNRCLP